MLGHSNNAVQVDKNLMEEILHAQHMREYERGLRPDPPAPLNRPKPVYSTQAVHDQQVSNDPTLDQQVEEYRQS